jgi:nucleoside-diphosphate-sugar epimerase
MEGIVSDAVAQHDLPAITLRFGSFYSHDSAQTRGMLGLIQKGLFPIPGDGKDYWNLINADDAAEAVIKAIDNHEAGLGQTFNVCDDEPVQYGEMVRFIAKTLGARKPARIPRSLGRVALGGHVVEAIFSSMRCRNQLAREKLGWAPRYPTFREGYRAEIDRWLQLAE